MVLANSIHENKGGYGLQRLVLPCCDLRRDFLLILVISSGEISTSYSFLICSAISCWLNLQKYKARVFSFMLSAFWPYLSIIFGSKLPFRSRSTLMSTLPSWSFHRLFHVAVAVSCHKLYAPNGTRNPTLRSSPLL